MTFDRFDTMIDRIREISEWIDADPGMSEASRELRIRDRLSLIVNRFDVVDMMAMEHQRYGEIDYGDVKDGLLDIATQCLAAVEHLNGNNSSSGKLLFDYVTSIYNRVETEKD